jgi:hypothetical protein
VWEALHGNALRKSTLSGKLSAIDRLYRFVADLMDEDCLGSGPINFRSTFLVESGVSDW